MRADQRFEQRIAREAISSMQTGASDLANRVKTRNVRSAIHIGHHSAALVMCRGHDRDRFARHICAVLETRLINIWEPFANELRWPVRNIEQDVIRATLLHFT